VPARDRSVDQVAKDFDPTETAVRKWVKHAERETGTRQDGGLISHAAGLTSDSAAELICAHHTWLTRTDFTTSYIHSGTSPGRHPYAYIDWEHAITALDSHQLSCTPSEAAILRIAASLGDHHIPVHLARVLGSLDHTSIARVTIAITAANG
jgi:hypothetical protein